MDGCRGYEVMKFVEYGKKCYVSTDYVTGRTLTQYLKYHPCISKEQLFLWLGEIVRQLERFHRCRGNPCYQYVNPYSVIITAEEKLLLLDVGSGKQEELLRMMQRRSIRENFLAEHNLYYQKNNEEADIYGLGKTMQYILATAEPEPALTKREEIVFRKIIFRCINQHSKKKYQTIQEISEHFPKIREKHCKKSFTEKRKVMLTAAAVTVALLAAGLTFTETKDTGHLVKKEGEQQESEQQEEGRQQQKGEQIPTEREIQLQFDMAMLYFVDMKEYEKSRKLFADIKEEYGLAEYYEELCSYLLQGDKKTGTEGLDRLLIKITEAIPDEETSAYYFSILEGYALLDIKKSANSIIDLGEKCLALEDWKNGDMYHEREEELKERMAPAYEEKEDLERAIQLYLELLDIQSSKPEREILYRKLAILNEKQGHTDKAWEICKEGIEEIAQSKELWLLLIRMQCKNESVEREICAETIRKCLKEIPEIAEEPEFLKIKQEYEIKLEGEQVWVGR